MRDSKPTYIETSDMSHMIPMRISVSKLKQMSDAELLAALNGEDGRKGMMTMQFIQLITSELQARNIEKASKPHWSTVPSFWLLVTSLVLSIIAIVISVFALPQVQLRIFPIQQKLQASALGQNNKEGSQQVSKNLKQTQPILKKLP
jgi:hypothetical protein